MVRRLFIYLGPDAPATVQWAATSATGRLRSGQGPLNEVPHSPGERLVVLLPGPDVLVTEVEIPGPRKRLLRQSLPFLLEENLAAEVEEMHFACGPLSAAGKIPVAVVARGRLSRWITMLSEAGLHPTVMTPTTLAVPINPEGWTLVLTDAGFLARHGKWRVFAGEIANLGHYLRGETSLAAAAGTGNNVEVFNCTEQEPDLQLAGLTLSPTRPAQLLQLLAEGFTSAPSLNLLQGAYAGSAHWRGALRRWQAPLAAAAALLLLLSVDLTLDELRLRNESTRLGKEITATFLQAFPDTHRVVNARVQMEQKLKEHLAANRRNNFFTLYDKTAPLLAAAGTPAVEVIRFHDGRLELDLSLATLEVLDKLKEDLNKAPGVAAEIRNAESSGGRVRARLSVGGTG